jgi:putative hemolysin
MEVSKDESSLKPIVLKELVAEKNPKLARRIPRLVYYLMNKLLHIREVNELITKFGHLKGIEFIDALIKNANVRFNFRNIENLPKEGRYIFVSNHPLGGFDGLLLIFGVNKFVGKSLFLVRDELTKIPPLKELFIPINKFGDQRRSASLINEAYESENQILIFPAGLASRKIKGKITDLKWQKHFVQKSSEYKRDIIPVHIDGRNSWFFYCLSNFRQRIGIKTNIEMFLLSDEMFKQKGKTFTITFGKPIPWNTFDHSKHAVEWAEEVKKIAYGLSQNTKK